MSSRDKILALDLGANKTGLALATEGFVVGRGVIGGYNDLTKLFSDLAEVIKKEGEVGKIVIGIPRSKSGEREKAYRTYINALNKEFGLAIETVDETLTSREARARGARAQDDEEAAKIILEDYLAQNRH